MTSLFDILSTPRTPEDERIYGVVTGIVTNNTDPDDLARVKLRFPWLSSRGEESWWARIVAPMAGGQRGLYLLPEVGDEVLVAFEHGDIRFPYVVGSLWSSNDKPPEKNDKGENNVRTIKSRSGHEIRLDDTKGEEKITIVDQKQKQKVVFDSKAQTITIEAEADLTIESKNGKLTLKGGQGVEIESKGGVKVHATNALDLLGDGPTTLKGTVVKIN